MNVRILLKRLPPKGKDIRDTMIAAIDRAWPSKDFTEYEAKLLRDYRRNAVGVTTDEFLSTFKDAEKIGNGLRFYSQHGLDLTKSMSIKKIEIWGKRAKPDAATIFTMYAGKKTPDGSGWALLDRSYRSAKPGPGSMDTFIDDLYGDIPKADGPFMTEHFTWNSMKEFPDTQTIYIGSRFIANDVAVSLSRGLRTSYGSTTRYDANGGGITLRPTDTGEFLESYEAFTGTSAASMPTLAKTDYPDVAMFRGNEPGEIHSYFSDEEPFIDKVVYIDAYSLVVMGPRLARGGTQK